MVVSTTEKIMNIRKTIAIIILILLPPATFAQYSNLDAAMAGLSRGFERGETGPILEGIAADEKVNLEFPGLVSESGFFGRDQASYLLDELFNKAKPSGFVRQSAKKVSAENQYHITGKWTIQSGGRPQDRVLSITLRNRGDRWSIVSIRSGG